MEIVKTRRGKKTHKKKLKKKKQVVLVRKISNDDYFLNVNKTTKQKNQYYDSTLDIVEKIQDDDGNIRNIELLHKVFLPLIKGYVKKYYARIAHTKYYEYEDFINEVNCMFFELVKEYKPKYNSAKFFVFYMKFMLERRIMGFITDFYRTPLPSYVDVSDFHEIQHHDNVDDQIFMRYFWNIVEEEVSKFPKGKKFMKKYFFSDKPYTIKEINKEFNSNMYVVFDKVKKKVKERFGNSAKELINENN